MVELIRSGKAPGVIRRKGAEGSLPLPLPDKIEILISLATAPEREVREKALETLRAWNRLELRGIMASPQTVPNVLVFAAEQLLAGWEELRDILLCNPSLPLKVKNLLQAKPAANASDVKAAVQQTTTETLVAPEPVAEPLAEENAVEILARLAAGAQILDAKGLPVEAPPEAIKHDDELTPKDRETLIEKIHRMAVVQKIKAAITGNLETRSLLVRDSNKIVSRAVLQSPKISETEAESYAAAKNVSEEVLRSIAMNRRFTKSYVVIRALTHNPRAPIDVTVPLVRRMKDRDLKGLAMNRNVPDVIRNIAVKTIKQKEDASKMKTPGRH